MVYCVLVKSWEIFDYLISYQKIDVEGFCYEINEMMKTCVEVENGLAAIEVVCRVASLNEDVENVRHSPLEDFMTALLVNPNFKSEERLKILYKLIEDGLYISEETVDDFKMYHPDDEIICKTLNDVRSPDIKEPAED